MSHLLARPLGSLPLTAQQRRVRALPPLVLDSPSLADAVTEFDPHPYLAPLPELIAHATTPTPPRRLPMPDVVVDGVPVVAPSGQAAAHA